MGFALINEPSREITRLCGKEMACQLCDATKAAFMLDGLLFGCVRVACAGRATGICDPFCYGAKGIFMALRFAQYCRNVGSRSVSTRFTENG